MYVIDPEVKTDPARRWALPDRVCLAAGACHILAHVATGAWAGFTPLWLRPVAGYTGNHIVARRGECVFDYHGFTRLPDLRAHTRAKARWWPGWACTIEELPRAALTRLEIGRRFDGLHLRPPEQFLHDPIPRAEAFSRRFAAPL